MQENSSDCAKVESFAGSGAVLDHGLRCVTGFDYRRESEDDAEPNLWIGH